MEEIPFAFAFFPYLKTSKPIKYRDLSIRSVIDYFGLYADAKPYFEQLKQIFFIRDHVRIQYFSYAYYYLVNKNTYNEFVQQLREFKELISFVYSSPHPVFGDPFLMSEHASFFIFFPKSFSKHLISALLKRV